jgi:hypothetical protein
LAELKPYRARLWSHAGEETRRYWNSYRVGTAIASPVVTAIFWVAVKGWAGWQPVLYALLVGIAIFLSGWGIVFIVSFGLSPSALDAQSQHTITGLSEQLALPDKVLAAHLAKLLEKVGPNGQEAIKFVLLYEEVSRQQITIETLSEQDTTAALRACVNEGLMNARYEQHGSFGMFVLSFYWVPEGFRPTLKKILYTSSVAVSFPFSPPKSSN